MSLAHADPITPVLLALALILAAAKLGGHLAERLGQPAVLGELGAGVVLGNLGLLALPPLPIPAPGGVIDGLARLGAVLLLFEVGLESSLGAMRRVGLRALAVAVLGVVAPWGLGWWVGAMVLPSHGALVHAFLGATLTATSVGITARVLKDLGRSQSAEARVILGAAVIDDVLGLVILAGLGSVILAAGRGAAVSYGEVGGVLLKALLFLGGALALGVAVVPRLFRAAARLRGHGVLLATALAFCFALSFLASSVGLAAIVGAYAAGLLLEEVHWRDFADRGERRLEDLVRPLSTFLVPVFFVLMGMRVDLRAFAHPEVLGLTALLTLAAIAGKQACALGAWGARELDRLTLGIGMIPRGEVGLIFASWGLGLSVQGERIVDEATFSAVVLMVMLTTFITPPALAWSLARAARHRAGSVAPGESRPPRPAEAGAEL